MSAVASHMSNAPARRDRVLPWVPLLALIAIVLLCGASLHPAVSAWLLAASIYVGFKWLAFANSSVARRASRRDSLLFLLLWPGMDADAFLTERPVTQPNVREVASAAALMLLGLITIFALPTLPLSTEVRGWTALVAIALFLLFGVAQTISIAWRICGVDAQPIMNKPMRATSLADFWGARWNLPFHDIGRIFVWRPVAKRFGWPTATMAVFLFSGVIHDLAMSIPARGGWGLPTIYFLLQGVAVLFERSPLGKRWQLSRGWRGRAFAALFVLGPLGLLFHQPFLQRVVLPTIDWLTPS
ncbi:MBOAT family protein [Anatilimnocola floriformis]|uniref:MBOAT family protein n=1 Tax=Anatilimnocola floriformis TaxID=2948575 RepID=UPI0020C1DC83|nr:MBOAT family protein [Anatilimnocola floriformis]